MGNLTKARERSVLLIAFQFPPFAGSSGLQRTLRFAQYLPKFGWKPIVLTIVASAHEQRSISTGNEVRSGLDIQRAFGLDAARQLSIMGRYPRFLAVPDRWSSWRFHAIGKAQRIIRRHGISVIWSTFPIATAHRIGIEVAKRTGLPWIAEFRDPMWQGDYPPDAAINRAWKKLEEELFDTASRVVVTTPGARELYSNRFPHFSRVNISLIENGFDEDAFQRASNSAFAVVAEKSAGTRPIKILHSGVIYRSERDPSSLFAALSDLKREGLISAAKIRIVFRAAGGEVSLQDEIDCAGIGDIVSLQPSTTYLEALREMTDADGLLVLQAANCNAQIPAKLYEYLRAGRPILALTDPAGDTAQAAKLAVASVTAKLDSKECIKAAVVKFIDVIVSYGNKPLAKDAYIDYSREYQTGLLAKLLDSVA